MSYIRSFSVGNGDMFYICHNSDSFSIIDCCMNDVNKDTIVNEIKNAKTKKNILRFISTHPDEDHLQGLKYLDEKIRLDNFYCVKNAAIKKDKTTDFDYYCKLRDSNRAFYITRGFSRKWINDSDNVRDSAGISFIWPDINNQYFKDALSEVARGEAFNNISPIFLYSFGKGASVMWMGDIERDFLDKVKNFITWPKIDILFAPHHGRESGKVPSDILKKLAPKIIVIGEAPSEFLNYYSGYNTISQNTARELLFDCYNEKVDIYCGNLSYNVDFLEHERAQISGWKYLGSLKTKRV